MTYTIYLRRNKVNGKCYVGQTNNFKWREYQWGCLKCYYANEHLSNDRAKYGLDNWTVEMLAEVDTREEAWELEQRFINDFNTLWPNGYNITEGGAGPKGCKHTEKARQKMSESHKGKHHSDETRQKISEANKGENNPNWGKHCSDKTKQKISEANKGKHHTDETKQKMSEAKPKKQVYQYTLDGKLVAIWPSVMECGRNGFNIGNISMCCNGKKKTHKGFRWSYTPL